MLTTVANCSSNAATRAFNSSKRLSICVHRPLQAHVFHMTCVTGASWDDAAAGVCGTGAAAGVAAGTGGARILGGGGGGAISAKPTLGWSTGATTGGVAGAAAGAAGCGDTGDTGAGGRCALSFSVGVGVVADRDKELAAANEETPPPPPAVDDADMFRDPASAEVTYCSVGYFRPPYWRYQSNSATLFWCALLRQWPLSCSPVNVHAPHKMQW